MKTKTKRTNKTKNQIIVVPTTQKNKIAVSPKNVRSAHSKTKTNAADYYNCLLTYANQDWHSPSGQKKKITACCRDCKLNAPVLKQQRETELVKLITSYKQVGDSLAKLLQPLK